MSKSTSKTKKILLITGLLLCFIVLFNSTAKFAVINFFNISTGAKLNIKKLRIGFGEILVNNAVIYVAEKQKRGAVVKNTVLTAEKIKISYNFFNAFRKRSVIGKVEIVKPALRLKRTGFDKWNTSFFFKKKKKLRLARKEKYKHIYIGEALVENGSIEIEDKIVAKTTTKISNINLHYDYFDKERTVTGSAVEKNGLISVKGSIKNKTILTKLITPEIKLADYINFLFYGKDFLVKDGAARLDLTFVTDTKSRITDYQGKFSLKGARLYSRQWPYEFLNLNGELDIINNSLFVKNLSGLFAGAQVRAEGCLTDFSYPFLNLKISAARFDIKAIEKFWREKFKIDLWGSCAASIEFAGKADKPLVTVKIQSGRVNYFIDSQKAPREIADIDFQGRFYEDAFFVDNASARINAGQVRAGGVYIFEGKPRAVLFVKTKDLFLNSDMARRFAATNISAKTDLDIGVTGEVAAPVVFGAAQISQINAGVEIPGSAQFDFIYDKDLFCLDRADVFQNNKKVAAARATVDLKKQDIVFNAFAGGLAFGGGKNNVFNVQSGKINLVAAVLGSMRSPYIYAALNDSDINLYGFSAQKVRGEIYANPQGALLNKASALVSSAYVDFGFYQDKENKDLQLFLRGKNLDLEPVNRLFANIKGVKIPLFKAHSDISVYAGGDKQKGYFYNCALKSNLEAAKISGFKPPGEEPLTISILRARGINIGEIVSEPAFIKGTASVNSFIWTNKNSVSSSGSFSLNNALVWKLPFTDGYYEATVEKNGVNLKNLTFFGRALFLNLRGAISNKNFDLKYDIINRNLYSLDNITRFFAWKENFVRARDIKFEALSRGSLSLKNKKIDAEGEFQIPGGLLKDEFFKLSAEFKYSNNALGFKTLTFYQDAGRALVKGIVGTGSGAKINLNVITDNLNLSKILAVTPLSEQKIQGRLYSNFSVKGNLEKPLIEGSADVFGLKLAGKLFKEIKLNLKSENDRFALSDLKIIVNRGQIFGSGSVNSKGDLDFKFYADEFPIEEIPFLSDRINSLRGFGNFNLTVFGRKTNPELLGKLEYENIVINGRDFSKAMCNIALKDGVLSFAPLYIEETPAGAEAKQAASKKDASFYSVEGSVGLFGSAAPPGTKDKSPVFNIKANIQNGTLSTMLALLNSPLKDSIDGVVNSSLFFGGTLLNPYISLNGSLNQALFAGSRIDSLVVNAEFKDNALIINNALLKQSDAFAQAAGFAGKQGEIELSLKTENLDVAMFNPFIPSGHKLEGRLDAAVSVKNNVLYPEAEAVFKLNKGSFDNFAFDALSGKILGQKGFLYLDNLKISKGKHEINFYGKMPIVMKRGDFYTSAPLELNIKFAEQDLSALNIFGNFIESSKGQITGDVNFAGPLYDIKMKGRVAIKNGEAKFYGVQTPLDDIDMKLVFVDDKLRVDNFEVKAGGGKIKAEGEITFEKFFPKYYDLKLGLDNLKIYASKYYSGSLNGNLALKGPVEDKILSGSVKASDGNLNIMEIIKSAPALVKNEKNLSAARRGRVIIYNMDLILDKVWLNNQSSALKTYFKSTGLLEVRGSDFRPTLKGEIDFSQGNIDFYNTTFKVIDGMAFFDGKENLMPKIDLEARTKVSDVDIFVNITGSIDRPINSFSSDPPLTEREIVALLAMKILPGVPFKDSSFVSKSMYSALQMSLLQPILQSIGKDLIMGSVGFEYAPGGIWSVKIAKAIDKDEKFYVTFSRVYGINGIENRVWGIEYKLQKRTILVVEQDNYGNYFFAIKATY